MASAHACDHCHVEFPVGMLTYRQREKPLYLCPVCDRMLMVRERAEDKAKAKEQAQAEAAEKANAADDRKLMRLATRQRINAVHISELNEMIMRRFGSVEQFVDFYYEQTMQAATLNPGGKVALDACHKIVQIVIASTAHRQSAPDVENLSDEDLEREAVALLNEAALRKRLQGPTVEENSDGSDG